MEQMDLTIEIQCRPERITGAFLWEFEDTLKEEVVELFRRHGGVESTVRSFRVIEVPLVRDFEDSWISDIHIAVKVTSPLVNQFLDVHDQSRFMDRLGDALTELFPDHPHQVKLKPA